MPLRPSVRRTFTLALVVAGIAGAQLAFRLGREVGEARTLVCTDQCQRLGYRWGYVDPGRPADCDCRPERVSQLAMWLGEQGTWP